jgi:hypothetical protein
VPQEHQTITGEPPEEIVQGDEEIDDTGITANEAVEVARNEGLQGPVPDEEIEFVPATPEAIAEAVQENETAQAKEDEEKAA